MTGLRLNSVKKLVRYLKGTKEIGIFYLAKVGDKSSGFNLVGYIDVAFADCVDSRKSAGGYLF